MTFSPGIIVRNDETYCVYTDILSRRNGFSAEGEISTRCLAQGRNRPGKKILWTATRQWLNIGTNSSRDENSLVNELLNNHTSFLLAKRSGSNNDMTILKVGFRITRQRLFVSRSDWSGQRTKIQHQAKRKERNNTVNRSKLGARAWKQC